MSNDAPSSTQGSAGPSPTNQRPVLTSSWAQAFAKLGEEHDAAIRHEQERLGQAHKIEENRLGENIIAAQARAKNAQKLLDQAHENTKACLQDIIATKDARLRAQETAVQLHKNEVARLQETITVKDARIQELEEALRNRHAKGWEPMWVSEDGLWRCPNCFVEVLDDDAEYDEAVDSPKNPPEGCDMCQLRRGDPYATNRGDEEGEVDDHEVDDHEVDDHEVDDHEVDDHEVDDHEVDDHEVDDHEVDADKGDGDEAEDDEMEDSWIVNDEVEDGEEDYSGVDDDEI
jgi:hypothetical protein